MPSRNKPAPRKAARARPAKEPLQSRPSRQDRREPDHRVYGLNACLALAKMRPQAIVRMYLSKDLVPLFNETLRFLASKNLPYRLLPDNELQKVSGSTHHEGVCIIAAPISTSEDRLPSYLERASGCVLFLDDVQNPHNFGAIVRTAAHLGAGAVLVTDAGFSPLSGAAYRVAEGGAEEIPVFQVSDAKKTLELLKQRKFTLVATVVEKGTSLFEAKLPERLVFLLGAEDRGLRNDLRRMADLHVTIPHLGEVESLNVATATGILLAEYQRQRSSSSGRGRRE